MLKRRPSELIIENKKLLIPIVQCIVYGKFIKLESKSRKLEFKILCPIHKTLEEDDFLDMYLNTYPDFNHGEQSYYYQRYNFEDSSIYIEGEKFEILNGNIQINYLSIRDFSVEMDLELKSHDNQIIFSKWFLYPVIKEADNIEENLYFKNLIPKIVINPDESTEHSTTAKPIEELCLEDFSVSPVWEWDLENENLMIQDETWVKPSHIDKIFMIDMAEIFIKADLRIGSQITSYPCILNIAIDQSIHQLAILEGSVYINREYIMLEDFFIEQTSLNQVTFYIQDQVFKVKLNRTGRKIPIDLKLTV
ncbi:hypothetical protein [Bacillus sp. 123MFChir2]|uniref:hypothetical protein n=1 Tax=Bacillus sp. 123MFChir2 TaxID=1169144 RepID=UPI0003790B22|nr:hypothetical protein [Bacillus sp. 123MFChir2]